MGAVEQLTNKLKTLSEQIVIFCLKLALACQDMNMQDKHLFQDAQTSCHELFARTFHFTNKRMTKFHTSLTLYVPIRQYMLSVSHIICAAKNMLQNLF